MKTLSGNGHGKHIVYDLVNDLVHVKTISAVSSNYLWWDIIGNSFVFIPSLVLEAA